MAQNNDAPVRVEIFTPFHKIFSTHFFLILFFIREQFLRQNKFYTNSCPEKSSCLICTFQTLQIFCQTICVFEKFFTICMCDMKPQHAIFREKEKSVQLQISQKLANRKSKFLSFNFLQKIHLKIKPF